MHTLFTIILFLWAMVALFVIAQLIIVAVPQLLAFTPSTPAVFHYRRKQ